MRQNTIQWSSGYTDAELRRAQEMYELVFPADLVRLLSGPNPLGYDWRTDDEAIRKYLRWPYEGLLFDVEMNQLWLPDWGAKPERPEERAEVLKAIVDAAPKLIPLYGHRFLPEEPHEEGNPIFSVYQSDIIYYGSDLDNYILREFINGPNHPLPQKIKKIRFWSQFVWEGE